MKTLALIILALVTATGFAPAQDLGQPTSSTPYDKYFGRIRTVLSELSGSEPSLELVQELVKTGRGFRYVMKDPYVPQTPTETEQSPRRRLQSEVPLGGA